LISIFSGDSFLKYRVAKTYYEILGVPGNASELEIKSAYHRLARKYHPDKADASADAAAMEAEFSQISTAYNTLKDKDKRQAYNQILGSRHMSSNDSSSNKIPAVSSNASVSEQKVFSGPNSEKNKAMAAKRSFVRGAQLMSAGDYSKAAECFDNAIKNNDEEAVYHARLALALLRSHRSFTRATEAANRAISLDPYNSDFRLILAELYENANSKTMAIQTYEEIIKWDPNNTKARIALDQLKPSRGGILGKLFGKKK
jgi:curved DNA-binding protein CbpA